MKGKLRILILDAALVLCAYILITRWGDIARCLPSCPINRALDLYCPGCGGTRMLYHMIHARFWIAFRNNPYLFLLGIYLSALLVLVNISCLTGRNVHKPLVKEKWLWFWAVLALAFFVLRNIPFAPFTYLVPMRFW